jgi:hypothetical protein
MLSPSLSQLLERARSGFGLEVEILDAGLNHVYPESGGMVASVLRESPAIRRSVLESLAAGRPEQLERPDATYRLVPLRVSAGLRHAGGVLAVRRTSQNGAAAAVESWTELARAIVEADFAAADALNEEKLQSRRLLATLRFLRHLVELDTELELSQAIVQAAAVWFDVDARIYQRDLSGDFCLHTALPGAHIDDAGRRLNPAWLASATEITRASSVAEWGQMPAGTEVVLVPLAGGVNVNTDGVLTLIGSVPAHAEPVLPILGSMVATQIDAIRGRRREQAREGFEGLVNQPEVAPSLIPAHMIREVIDRTGAASAEVRMTRDGTPRLLASQGSTGPQVHVSEVPAGPFVGREWRFGPDQFVCDLSLGVDAWATLVVRPRAGEGFTPDAAMMVREAARVLHTWLRGAEALALTAIPAALPEHTPAMPAFLARIEEELERAKRLDLRLSLLLVSVPDTRGGDSEAVTQVHDTLRRELRGSDVLGNMSRQRVAALLTHTEGSGSHRVVGRVQHRLAETAGRLSLAGVTVGHAIFSPACCTVEALVSQAISAAEPVGAL